MTIAIFPHMIRRQSSVVGMAANEFSDVLLFRRCVEKFTQSLARRTGPPMSRTTHDHATGEVIAFEANTPEVDEVAILAMRFRLFCAQGEPTQFQKILKIVRRRIQDDWADGYLDKLDIWYKEAMKDTQVSKDLGHPITNREIIDLWFNSEFFHSEPKKREALENIHTVIGETPSLFQLYVAIGRCAAHLQSLYSVVHRLDVSHQFIYTPDHHFGRQKEGN
ncbi:hypothetical protein [Acidovorax sp. FJL06]|uniref:hypothetical protein n=1 Tax=Acidovorax sp. FJL06 TaxID=2153365 RepID=UPI000F58D22A|nr:hypothetical protein [Acidovorax sp. FJL06]